MKVGPVSKSVAIQQYWKCYASHKNILGFFLALAAGVTTKPIIPRNTYISTCHKALAFLFHPLQFPARADRHPSIIIHVGGRPGLDTHHISSDFIIRTYVTDQKLEVWVCVLGVGEGHPLRIHGDREPIDEHAPLRKVDRTRESSAKRPGNEGEQKGMRHDQFSKARNS